MKFGTFHLMERPFWKSEPQVIAEHLEQMRLADELGFDAVWLTEHHFSSVPYVPDVLGEYGISASPLALACAVSQITRRVRIGTAVKVLALEHPLRTAEDAALADLLSLGRLDFGAGLGYRNYEFEGLGVPIEEKNERFGRGRTRSSPTPGGSTRSRGCRCSPGPISGPIRRSGSPAVSGQRRSSTSR